MFSAFAWYLASLKSNTLTTDLYFRGTESEWERGTGASVCLCDLVCASALYCRRAQRFNAGFVFLPIKQAPVSTTMPEPRVSGAPGCYLRGAQLKLGYVVHIKTLIAAKHS